VTNPAKQKLLSIATSKTGFYKGFNRIVAIGSKVLVGCLILWAGLLPVKAGEVLLTLQNWSTSAFGAWYVYVTTFYLFTCLFLAVWPKTASVKLGKADEAPEFSRFSWFSMMFSAGIGVGMLTYSTAEPIFHFANNPDVIKGLSSAAAEDNVRNAYKWAMLHYGLTPWACYGIVGMALAYAAFNRNLPLAIRSSLEPLFGRALSGPLGHLVDIAAIVATVIGLGVTIGYGYHSSPQAHSIFLLHSGWSTQMEARR